MTQIRFYRPQDQYGCFSNFSDHPVMVDGVIYRTNEHYFQSQKFVSTNLDYFNAIRTSTTAKQAADLGRSRHVPIRTDWETAKEDVMMRGLRAKFTQNPECKEALLDTGSCELLEESTKDSYWGTGPKGNGQNRLGILLMNLREELGGSGVTKSADALNLEEQFMKVQHEVQEEADRLMDQVRSCISKISDLAEAKGVPVSTDFAIIEKSNTYMPRSFAKSEYKRIDLDETLDLYRSYDVEGWESESWSTSSLSC